MACLAAYGQTQAQKAAPTPSALDKATLEAYIRHLFVWGNNIRVEISDPVPSPDLPGFYAIKVHATAGQASQDETFQVSHDGRKIVRGPIFDVTQNPFKHEMDKLKTESQPSMGTQGAPVVLVQFTDFECPFCGQEAKMLRQNLLSAYPKEVHLYFEDFPLPQIHPWARPAAIAGRCIYHQSEAAFWDYYDWIYAHQTEINPDNFKDKLSEFAKGRQVDAMQLNACLASPATEAEVDRSIAEAKSLQVTSTPTLFINGRRIEGQIPWPNLREIIDYEIEYQKTAKNAGENCSATASTGCEVLLPSPLGKQGFRR
jgi:protein-disulfide isomerase